MIRTISYIDIYTLMYKYPNLPGNAIVIEILTYRYSEKDYKKGKHNIEESPRGAASYIWYGDDPHRIISAAGNQ